MKLYKTEGLIPHQEGDVHEIKWAGSLGNASKDRVALRKDGFKDPKTTEEDVPTNKVDLIVWLNKNAS